MPYRIGVDVGGTFTDFLVLDERGAHQILKSPTVPSDPSVGVFAGLEAYAGQRGMTLDDLLARTAAIVHGTTIATNAVLTGRGARTGFLTTEGFRDILNMRRGLSDARYDWKRRPPSDLVPRERIATARGRIDVSGTEVEALDEDAVRAAAQIFKDAGVEAVAVSFLWSFLNPAHEQRAGALLGEVLGEAHLSLSHEVLPQIRLYERNSTTALNAFVGPPLARYLTRLEDGLARKGFSGTLLIMQSNGGVMAPDMAGRFAVNTLLSGPAAAPVAGLHYGRTHGVDNLITVDMGGTSFDVALIRGGVPATTTEARLGGYHVGVPMLDIHTIGAGGGSIAWVDGGGILHVGPDSAGADPGPACYGLGGRAPTVTDADLVLGYLDAENFAAGSLKLDRAAAERALRTHVAEPLGLDLVGAAHGVYRIVNTLMADAVKVKSVQRGDDPAEFALIVAGGAGPIHACPIARDLGIETVLIPRESSVLCAAGMLLSDLKHSYVRTAASDLDGLDTARAQSILDDMRAQATATLAAEGIAPARVRLEFGADLRYVGQFNEVEVAAFPAGRIDAAAVAALADAFHARHDRLYGYAMPGAPIELINLRLTALGITDKPALAARTETAAAAAPRSVREAYFDGAFHAVHVYDGLALAPGQHVAGPAIVEQPTTTIVLERGFDLACDAHGNYLVTQRSAE